MPANDPHDAPSGAIAPLEPHVIVLFGATGDLARRKLLPGLLHLSRAGLMSEFRIVGVSLEPLDGPGVPRLGAHGLRRVRPRHHHRGRLERLRQPALLRRSGQGPEGLARVAGIAADAARRATAAPALPQRPARGGAVGGSRARVRGPHRARADHHGEAVRHRPRERHPAQQRGPRGVPARSRSSASTTSSARRRRRTSSPCASPTASSSRSGTASTSTTSRSTCPRRSRSARAAASTRRPAPTATWSSPT